MRILPDFGPARANPPFRRLLIGGLLSSLRSAMTTFAVTLQIWDLSRSSGNVESGLVASLTSPVISAVSGGIGCFAVAVAIMFAVPAFTRYRAEPAAQPAPETVPTTQA